MTGPDGTGALARSEIDQLLRRSLIARLATVDPDGYPAIVPVWHDWDGEAAWLVARAEARFVQDIRRDARVGLSVVADDDPDLRVQLRGRATIVDGPGPLAGRMLEIALAMGERYEGPAGLTYVEATRAWPRCLIRIDPVRIVAWGSPEWHDRYKQTAKTDAGRLNA
ncbi:MAG: pyridoxamine 5'-phosphate oxidase family protein [Chloroflexi bacterium]|nr:pyridoxamine 5'-phosphate oxidase family protein [Chloroflexota bacterium]